MNIASFALKNLGRNYRRTFIAVGGIAFAAYIMIIWTVLIDGMMFMMRENITKVEYGQVQIHPEDYRNQSELHNTIPGHEQIITKLLGAGYQATSRLKTFTLAAANEASSGAQLRGVNPKTERTVTEIHKHVKTGNWLDGNDMTGAVIGATLAKQLGVSLGDEIVILGQADDGSVANAIVFVRGVLKAVSTEVDRSALYVNERMFRDFSILDKGFHEIAIKIPSGTERTLDDFRNEITTFAPGGQIETWREFLPIFAEMLDMMDGSMVFMLLIAYFALGLLLINSSLMSVFERIKELGVMKALGFRPRQVVELILAEIVWQSLIASAIAIVFAIPTCWYLQEHGIDISMFTGTLSWAGVAMEPMWYGIMSVKSFVIPVVTMFFIIAFSSLYPAIKAAVINPVDAIYHS